MTEATLELQPCPFCKAAAALRPVSVPAAETAEAPVFWIECGREDLCCLAGPSRTTPQAAAEAWNCIEVRK